MQKATKKIKKEKKLQTKAKILWLKRQPCEVYSRIVGYIRPVQNWHIGKKSEFIDRKTYDKILRPSGI